MDRSIIARMISVANRSEDQRNKTNSQMHLVNLFIYLFTHSLIHIQRNIVSQEKHRNE